MTIDPKLLYLADDLFVKKTGQHLTNVQLAILERALGDRSKSYREISQEKDYTEQYLKEEVAKLWKQLSKVLEEGVQKIILKPPYNNGCHRKSCCQYKRNKRMN